MTDFTPFLPPGESQISLNPVFDNNSCAIFGLCHYFEIKIKAMRFSFDASERAASVLAGLQNNVDVNGHIWGSYVDKDLLSIKQYGIIDQRVWPDLADFNEFQWFASVPQDIIDTGKLFLKQWAIGDLVSVSDFTGDLILLEIKFTNGTTHLVVRINKDQYFDSYQPFIKPIGYNGSTIVNQWTIKINPTTMTNAKLVSNKGEWGFYIPATSETALIDKALNLGYPLITVNNGSNVDWSKNLPDITIN